VDAVERREVRVGGWREGEGVDDGVVGEGSDLAAGEVARLSR